jgi:hypothetical protein
VQGVHRQLSAPFEYGVFGDHMATMADHPAVDLTHDLHGLADEPARHRVAVAVD